MEETAPAETKDERELQLEKTRLALEKSAEHARLGVLYLWNDITVESGMVTKIIDKVDSADSSLIEKKSSEKKDDNDKPGEVKQNDVKPDDAFESYPEKTSLKKWAEDFCSQLWNRIKDCFGDLPGMASKLKCLAVFVAKQVFVEAAPIIGSADGLLDGLYNTTKSFCERFGVWLASRKVRISSGHPTAIVDGIIQGIDRSLLAGVYEVAKNSVTLGLNIASSGITSMIEPLASVLEMITKIMWRLAEVSIIRTFAKEAKDHYSRKEDENALHKDEARFTEWLLNAVKKVPLIAGMTYASHIVGDKMIFLQMFSKKGDDIISQEEFDRGVKYLDKIKQSGTNLLKNSDFQFDSGDNFVKALLKNMVDPPVRVITLDKPDDVITKEGKSKKGKKTIMQKLRNTLKKK